MPVFPQDGDGYPDTTAFLNNRWNQSTTKRNYTATVVEAGVGSGVGATINLARGVNMISVPLAPAESFTARSLIQHIADSNHNTDDDSPKSASNNWDVSWLISYDAVNQQFDTFVPALDWDSYDHDGDAATSEVFDDGFGVLGGQGYMVNVCLLYTSPSPRDRG